MAFYLPPQSVPVFDPPAIVMQAEAGLLKKPFATLMAHYAPPKASVFFNRESVDHGPAVRKAIVQQLLFAGGTISSTYVNSVQQVSITISAATSNTGTATVVSANAFPIFQGFSATGTGTNGATSAPRITFSISGGTMTITATINTAGSCVVNVAVVDPKVALVTGVQTGTITTATASGTATITSVSTTLSAVFFLGLSSTNNAQAFWGNKTSSGVTLTNATTVTLNAGSINNVSLTGSYLVVTFAAAALQSNVQQFVTTKSTLTSNTQAVTSVVQANSIVAWGGVTTGTNAFGGLPWAELTSGTVLTFTSNSAATFTAYTTVIEFVSGVLKSNQHGGVAISASTSGTATPGTAVTAANTLCAFLGNTGAGTTDATTSTRITLSNGTPTITANVTTSSSPTAGYGLYEFN